MKTRLLPVLLLIASASVVSAQSAAPPRPVSPTPATNPAVAPGEPEIIMPQVVLQVEDLSVEKVEAQLPPEEDLLPPVRTIPTLSEGELAVGEPTIPAAPVETEGPARPTNNRLLVQPQGRCARRTRPGRCAGTAALVVYRLERGRRRRQNLVR